ncbi:hypothetical protein FBU30_003047 [Linnemannia zychae]|nr:hypothetical protein FBU30_003047 [Linnemannia zychae]
MKVASIIVLSAIAAIACASHNTPKPQGDQHIRTLYARDRFARQSLLDNVNGSAPKAQAVDLSAMHKTQSAGSPSNELLKRSDDMDCDDDGDNGDYHKPPHHKPPHHKPLHHKPPHHKPPTDGGNNVDVHIGLDTIIKVKVDVIHKAYLGIVVDALVDIKADILAKIVLKLNINPDVDVGFAEKVKALVDAKVDAIIKAKLNADIHAKINDLVHSRCKSTCGKDVDAGILADITQALKIDLGHLLLGIDADILADIRVNLDALGLKVKADVDPALGLNLGAILGGVVGDAEKSKPAILADIKLAVLANL